MRALALLVALPVALAACRAAEPPKAPPPAEKASEGPDECLSRVLAEAHLNAFGDPPDTMYAGGSPLFDERTGRTTPRREYVAARHPELVARCPVP